MQRTGRYDDRIAEHDKAQPGWAAKWAQLEGVLLQLGGDDVVVPLVLDDWFVDWVAEERTVSIGAGIPIDLVAGEHSQCHQNTATLLLNGIADTIYTGYALSEDGLWRQHSWGERRNGVLLETTTPRLVYVGARLNFILALKFILSEGMADLVVKAMDKERF